MSKNLPELPDPQGHYGPYGQWHSFNKIPHSLKDLAFGGDLISCPVIKRRRVVSY